MRLLVRWLSNVVLILAVLLLLIVLIVPLVFAGRVAVVLSASMEPTLPVGALAVIMPVAPEEVEVGDIITFTPYWDPEVTISHRVNEILNEERIRFRTKGDANEDVDAWVVPGDEVKGRVVFDIPRLGYLVNYVLRYVRTRQGLIFLVILPSLVVIGGTVHTMIKPPSRRQQRLDLLRKRQRRWKR
jgi:signal peptidase